MATVGAPQKENRAPALSNGPLLSCGELKMMLGQCLKMASENKITASNTWGLPLIEHLDDLIKEDDPTRHPNFQRASVTLDAGVKIYSYRVDSVHTETFKILGGLGRASGPTDDAEGELGDGGVGENASPSKRKRRNQDLNPEATLEPTLEALNIKKFDLAFAVDPLFHKTSAQFDEGGARGLLLNNLSVYRGCELVFDSMDVPEAAVDDMDNPTISSGRLDLDVVRQQVETIITSSSKAAAGSAVERITPTLDNILGILGAAPGDGAAAQAEAFVRSVAQGAPIVSPDLPTAINGVPPPSPGGDASAMDMDDDDGMALPPAEPYGYGNDDNDDYGGGGGGGYDDYGGYDDDGDEDANGIAGDNNNNTTHHNGFGGGGEASASLEEDAITWLIAANEAASGGSYVTSSKGWAGASHWRYRAVRHRAVGDGTADDEDGDAASGFGGKKRGGGARKKNAPLDFVAFMESEGATEPEFEMLPKGGGRRSAKTARGKIAAKTLLPEDYHYKAEFLARYSLRPRTAVAVVGVASGGAGSGFGASIGNNNDFGDGGGAGFDDGDDDEGDAYYYGDNGGDGEWDGAFAEPDIGDELEMAQAAHKVEKVQVNYSRAAKQVDVRSLKELMWAGIQSVLAQRRNSENGGDSGPIEFQDILATVPAMNGAGRIEDLSIHLCFICVLHLANEHGLVVAGVTGLDHLLVSNVP